MKRILSTDEQIPKLKHATQLANTAATSPDIDRRLGALVLYAGIVDFLVIQAARLIEQIILKGQLAEGKEPTFQPHQDTYFYDSKISTGFILKGIRKQLPFHSPDLSTTSEADKSNTLATKMLDAGFDFLNCRNLVIHQIGNPERTFNQVIKICDRGIKAYHKFREAHKEFFEAAAPYRFGEKELEYFYGKK